MLETLLDSLFPYQRRIVCDASRFKLLNCSRQCGKSTMFAVEAVLNCITTPSDKWVALSRGERQVLEWISKARDLALYACALARRDGIQIECFPKREEILFSNGSRIIGIPANADTARGYSANVILDEFAYHQHAEEIWAAVFPFISNEISHKWKLRVGSTVAGRNNKFWELFAQHDSKFRKYLVPVSRAVADGLPLNIAELKKAIGDEDIWKQEYECIPVEGTTTLVPYELIHAAQSDAASIDYPLAELDRAGSDFFVGIDIGRKHDLTVIWCVELVGNRIITRIVRELRHVPFAEQERQISEILSRRRIVRCAIDATGIGAQLSETLARRFAGKVDECNFNVNFKAEIYLGMRRELDAGNLEIPRDDEIEEDIHSVQRVFTSGGNLLFYAPTNDDGHADRASSLALCLHALRSYKAHSTSVSSPKKFNPYELGYGFSRGAKII